MNEAETRAEHIDPALKAAGWGVVEGSKILREHRITDGPIEGRGKRGKRDIADYVLVYRNTKLVVVEAKAWDEELTEGVGQAKSYAGKLAVRYAYATNGRGIYAIDMETGKERHDLTQYPSPDELWAMTFAKANAWRERFAAVQFGLTATPKRKDNVDTYRYFGEPVFTYSLKEGINDGFLTPFRVKQIETTLDSYRYTSDDTVVEGEVEAGKLYEEPDFNRSIEIRERDKKRVEIFLSQINQSEKTLVFCANQAHALIVRDLINQLKSSKDPNYCQRVTADEGARGDEWLRDFQDNEKSIPTILTTSQKLSTGVDARNIRNIVLMRPINSMIEFKQIIGRGTRLFEGKDYFTIYDFVKAHLNFQDPEWDGPPQEEKPCPKCGQRPCACACVAPPPKPCEVCGKSPCECPSEPCAVCGQIRCVCEKKKKVKVKLADGKERSIQHMMMTTFWHPDGTPMSSKEFIDLLYGEVPDFFQSEAELRNLWSAPDTRAKLLAGLAEKGFGHDQLAEMQKCIDADKSDLFDVLAYVAYELQPVTRAVRADHARVYINSHFNAKQRAFPEFVLSHYVSVGVEELGQEKLTPLLKLKYNNAIADAVADLGQPNEIGRVFSGFQKHLYEGSAA